MYFTALWVGIAGDGRADLEGLECVQPSERFHRHGVYRSAHIPHCGVNNLRRRFLRMLRRDSREPLHGHRGKYERRDFWVVATGTKFDSLRKLTVFYFIKL
jgi:hypothetical protein